MPVNEASRAAIESFVELAVPPRFALLIDGAWGIGKTHLVKELVAALRDTSRSVLYISLNGLRDTAQIDQVIFQELHPLLGSKRVQQFGRVFAGMLKATLKVDVNDIDVSVAVGAPKVSIDSAAKDVEHIIFFDDFERCSVAIEELLGYINYFVEHSGLKVVVCTNEEALTRQYDDYKLQREKVFGIKVRLKADFESAYEQFVRELPTSLSDVLRAHQDLAQRVFEQAGYANLRALRQTLLLFDRVFQALPGAARENVEYRKEFFSLYCALSLENANSLLTSKDIEEFVGQGEVARIVKERQRNESEEPHPESLTGKYEWLRENRIAWQPPLFWQRLFIEGFIDEVALGALVDSHPYFQRVSTPDWKKLWWWYDLPHESFMPILATVVQQLNDGTLKNVYVLLHATGTILDLANKRLAGKITVHGWLKSSRKFFKGLSGDEAFARFDGDVPSELDLFGGYEGLGYTTSAVKFDQLVAFANESFASYKSARDAQTSNAMLLLLEQNADEFSLQIAQLTPAHRNGFFFFKTISVARFIEGVTTLKTAREWWRLADGVRSYVERVNKDTADPAEVAFFLKLRRRLKTLERSRKGEVTSEGIRVFIERAIDFALARWT